MAKVTFQIGSFGDDEIIKSELIKAGAKKHTDYNGELQNMTVYFDVTDQDGDVNHCQIDAELCLFSNI